MKDVLSQIKDDLGSEAVIISKREIRDHAFGMTARPMIEVTAAIDYDAAIFGTHIKGPALSVIAPQTLVKPRIDEPQTHIPVSEEIVELKAMMKEIIAQTGMNVHKNSSLRNSLMRRGIRAHLVDILLNKLGKDARIETIRELLQKVVRTNSAVEEKVWVFLGTTGVGKTTTMAKIAARSVLNEGKSVGLITLDTYRIGAIDQGRIYAKILNVPFISVTTAAEFRSALAQLASKDVILVDTVGRSPFCSDYIPQLGQYFDDIATCKFLLMPVATRDSEMNTITKTFAKLGIDRMIFTKEDEAIHTGSMITHNLLYRTPISYITNGQRVPEDIEGACSSKIVERCLGDIA